MGILMLELGKSFNLVGSAALRNYDVFDWMIELVGVSGAACFAILGYFDSSFADHQKKLNGHKPEPTKP